MLVLRSGIQTPLQMQRVYCYDDRFYQFAGDNELLPQVPLP